MSFNRKSLVAFCLLSTLGIACSRPSARQVQDDIATSLKANQNALNMAEWEASSDNNHAIFKRWKDTLAKPEDVCKGFAKKTGQELALFEEEIKSEEHKDLISPCSKMLIEKIENYWREEKSKLKEAAELPPTFKFPKNLQTRDVSRGYKTFTGGVADKEVILSFDDGPHPRYTDQILAALEAANAKALFFVLGQNSKYYPKVLGRVGSAGHSIGTHSMGHQCLPAKPVCEKSNGKMLTHEEALAQIKGGHQVVQSILGWVDPFFRFPYGETSPELSEFLKEKSVGEFNWSIDSEDWRNRTPVEILTSTMALIEKQGRGIVLFHDIHRRTVETLPQFLEQLYFKGYSVVLVRSSNPKDRRNSKLLK